MENKTSIFSKIFKNKTKNKYIICIDREYGSGGYEIGKKLAEDLGLDFYDENIIELKTMEGQVDPHNVSKDDSFLQGTIYDLYRENYSYSQEGFTTTDARFLAESKTIRDIGKKGGCVIIGKCAGYVLRNTEALSVFIGANYEDRLKRLIEVYKDKEDKAPIKMKKIDTRRQNHFNRFAKGDWGNINSYDLCLSSSKFTLDQIVEILKKTLEIKK